MAAWCVTDSLNSRMPLPERASDLRETLRTEEEKRDSEQEHEVGRELVQPIMRVPPSGERVVTLASATATSRRSGWPSSQSVESPAGSWSNTAA